MGFKFATIRNYDLQTTTDGFGHTFSKLFTEKKFETAYLHIVAYMHESFGIRYLMSSVITDIIERKNEGKMKTEEKKLNKILTTFNDDNEFTIEDFNKFLKDIENAVSEDTVIKFSRSVGLMRIIGKNFKIKLMLF